MKRMTYILAPLLLLAIAVLVGPRPAFEPFNAQAATNTPPLAQLEERVAQEEAAVPKLKPHNQARIVWADSVARTPYVLVYLHGFSASHKEGSPIHERFAQRYGCNLYLSRLAAHGIDDPDAFKNLEPAALVNSAKEAIARGKALGDSIILMSCSTGSTLSMYLAAQDPAVHSLIMYSPNIDIYDSKSYLLNAPWGKQLARTIFDGDYRQWSQDDSIGMFWTTRYHLDGMHALRNLVSETMTPATFKAISQPTFISYYYKDETHKDEVISIEAIHEMVPQLSTPPEQVRVVPTDKAGTHVISGAIMNPHWREVEAATWSFAEEVLQLQAR